MQTATCPPPERLRAYLSGKLDDTTSDSLAKHLLDCESCEQTATNLEREPDTLVELLQADLPAPATGPTTAPSQQSVEGQCVPMPSDLVLPSALVLPSEQVIPTELVIPSVLGQYELRSRLGTGGMGAVYLARHRSLDKNVAIKLLPALPAQNAEFVARFQREMRAAGKLDHPSIVRTTDAGQQQGIHFLVMDAIDGMDLSRIARDEVKLSVADACETARQAALGLSHAHEKGIVHRDIKPSNLILDTSGQVRILDFGLAQVGFWDSGSAEITTVGQLMGTLDYMAPEQAERGGAVDYRADLYSLGATLFRLLTGRAPLAAAPNLTPLEKLRLLATHKPPKLRSFRPDVPETLGQIVDSMLSRDPAERPASAMHAAELLDSFGSGSDLVGLLKRARSKPVPQDTHVQGNALFQPSFSVESRSSSNSHLATPDAALPHAAGNDRSRTGKYWIAWVAVATCFAMILGGVAFVLETSKGQLVIDSEADVHVKLVAIDEAGNRSNIDELLIEPGTKTTRLRNGNYEITLDAASDSFSVTNDRFTIRNGQTVVATISSKSSSEVAGIPQVAEDARLNNIVYAGESLDTWLRRLRFERSPEEIDRALTAIHALASADLQDVIEPAMTEFLVSQDGDSFYLKALFAVNGCTKDGFDEWLASVLPQLQSTVLQTSLLSRSAATLQENGANSVEEYQAFLDTLEELADSDSVELSDAALAVLRHLAVDFPEKSFAPEVQRESVRILVSKNLSNEFWLATPSQNASTIAADEVRGSEFLRAEMANRAIQAVSDNASSDKLWTQAVVVLRSLVEDGLKLTEAQRETIKAPLAQALKDALDSQRNGNLNFDLHSSFAPYVAPVTPLGKFETTLGSRPITVTNKLIVGLNLIKFCELEDALKPEITVLHDAYADASLYDNNRTNILADPPKNAWYSVAGYMQRATDNGFLFRQVVYLQTGFLLGKTKQDLFARFGEQREADIALEVDSYLDLLGSGSWRSQDNALEGLSKITDLEKFPKVAAALETLFSRDVFDRLKEFFPLWVQATGTDFLASYTRALRKAPVHQQFRLLAIEFPALSNLQCNDPSQLEALLAWCDGVMQGEPTESSEELAAATSKMLTGLLVEGDAINVACQQQVVDRLQTYPRLDDRKFWLATPLTRRCIDVEAIVRERNSFRPVLDQFKPYGKPMQQAIIRRAVDVIENETETDKVVICQALAVLDVAVKQHAKLSESIKSSLELNLKQRLAAVGQDLPSHAELVQTPGALNDAVKPEFESNEPKFSPMVDTRTGVRPEEFAGANEIILTLNLVLSMQLQGNLRPELQRLHESTEDLNIANPFHYSREGIAWIVEIGQTNAPQELVFHTWFLQTGAMLGKEMPELLGRPNKLMLAEKERQWRFVGPGDTLAIHVPQVLPQAGDPPVIQAGTQAPVTGFPVAVSAEGTIQLPFIQPLLVKDLELAEVTEKIRETYLAEQILSEKKTKPLSVSVNFLLRAGQQLELRNIAGNSAVTVPAK